MNDYVSLITHWVQNHEKHLQWKCTKSGPDHSGTWSVVLQVTDFPEFSGEGRSTSVAKREAAEKFWTYLLRTDPPKSSARNYVSELHTKLQLKIIDSCNFMSKRLDELWHITGTVTIDGEEISRTAIDSKIKSAKQKAAQELLLHINSLPRKMFYPPPQPPAEILPSVSCTVPTVTRISSGKHCSCNSNVRSDALIFIDGDNVPRQACYHYRCPVYCYLGKLTNFPPKSVDPETLCTAVTQIRCGWQSSDAADVLLTMDLALIANDKRNIKCYVISDDQIFQSVAIAGRQMGIAVEWCREVPSELLYS